MASAKGATLRSLKYDFVVVECKSCRLYGEMEFKALVAKFKASISVTRLRRSLVGRCERMCEDGVDRCDSGLSAKS